MNAKFLFTCDIIGVQTFKKVYAYVKYLHDVTYTPGQKFSHKKTAEIYVSTNYLHKKH